jgi:tetratricopeptide (TPR) repeat protein
MLWHVDYSLPISALRAAGGAPPEAGAARRLWDNNARERFPMRWMGLFFCVVMVSGWGSFRAWGQTNAASEQAARAQALVASGKPAEAIPIYEALVAASPGNATLLVNLAVAEFQAGRYRGVIEHCRSALKLQPDLTTAWLFLGAGYFKTGEPEQAVEPFEKVLAARPEERNAGLMLAEALLQLERYDEAAGRFAAASRLLPDETRVWYGLERSCDGVVRRVVGELEARAADSAYGNLLAGAAALRVGRYGIAFRRYREALAAQPAMRAALHSLVRVYEASGHADWAAEVKPRLASLPLPDCASAGLECSFEAKRFEEVLRVSEDDAAPASLFWRAKACEALADEALSRLARLPESPQLHELEARRLDEQGIFREAAQHWRQALRLAPESFELRKGLALSLYNAGDFEQAGPVLEELLAAHSDSAELQYLCGSTLLLREEVRKAVPYLEQALRIDPGSVQARGALGNALLQLGSFEEAIPNLTAALSGDEDGRVHYQLARAYQGAGRPEQAKQALAAYQEIVQRAEARRRALEGDAEIVAP